MAFERLSDQIHQETRIVARIGIGETYQGHLCDPAGDDPFSRLYGRQCFRHHNACVATMRS
jgi:hypothetical protein